MGPKFEKVVFTKGANKFRLTICDTLYGASLKLVRLNMTKLLTASEVDFLPDKHDKTRSDEVLVL